MTITRHKHSAALENSKQSQTLILRTLENHINDVLWTLESEAARISDASFAGFTVGLLSGSILTGINGLIAYHLFEKERIPYAGTTIITITSLCLNISFIGSLETSLKNSWRPRLESEKPLSNFFNSIPNAYWAAPKAFIDYPLTMLYESLLSAGRVVSFGILPFLPYLASIAFRRESIESIFGTTPISISNIEYHTVSTSFIIATAIGITDFLINGVKAAEQNRRNNIPTLYRSTATFFTKTLPRFCHETYATSRNVITSAFFGLKGRQVNTNNDTSTMLVKVSPKR